MDTRRASARCHSLIHARRCVKHACNVGRAFMRVARPVVNIKPFLLGETALWALVLRFAFACLRLWKAEVELSYLLALGVSSSDTRGCGCRRSSGRPWQPHRRLTASCPHLCTICTSLSITPSAKLGWGRSQRRPLSSSFLHVSPQRICA